MAEDNETSGSLEEAGIQHIMKSDHIDREQAEMRYAWKDKSKIFGEHTHPKVENDPDLSKQGLISAQENVPKNLAEGDWQQDLSQEAREALDNFDTTFVKAIANGVPEIIFDPKSPYTVKAETTVNPGRKVVALEAMGLPRHKRQEIDTENAKVSIVAVVIFRNVSAEGEMVFLRVLTDQGKWLQTNKVYMSSEILSGDIADMSKVSLIPIPEDEGKNWWEELLRPQKESALEKAS